MPYTQADVDALELKIKTFAGIRQTAFDNQSTSFDLEGAKVLLSEMRAQVAATAGSPTHVRYAAFSKGV